MNFTAIDFETATPDRASACAIGLVVVRDGKITKRFSSLIRPPNLAFSARNITIHGITPIDVADKPSFQELWPQLAIWLCGDVLVAHNASFDMSVLHRCLDAADLPWPQFKCACTVAMARQLLPGLKDHKLTTIAELFGIKLDHHKAGADAAACAKVAMILGRLADPCGVSHFAREFSDMCSPHRETGEGSGLRVSFSIDGFEGLEDFIDEEETAAKEPSMDARFAGRSFVFAGELSTMTREAAEAVVQEKGGHVGSSVSRKTDYVVVGDASLDAYERTGHTTGKLEKAVAVKAAGGKVKIIREAEFLLLIA